MNAAANIFVGLTEAPLAVRPFLRNLTDSQLFCLMVSGVASVAGTVLVAYSQLGVRLDYLLAASFMSAPGGLAMAKLLMQETSSAQTSSAQTSIDQNSTVTPEQPPDEPRQANVILAAAQGATDGLRLAVNIGAMLIASVSLLALADGLIGGAGWPSRPPLNSVSSGHWM